MYVYTMHVVWRKRAGSRQGKIQPAVAGAFRETARCHGPGGGSSCLLQSTNSIDAGLFVSVTF